MDHEPGHVHDFYADIEVIVDLQLDGAVSLAARTDAEANQTCGTSSREPPNISTNW
jgi:hypothetical protein